MTTTEDLRETLRSAAAVLKAAGAPFALGGSYALWVHGAPEPTHDVDFVVAEEETERTADVLKHAGFAIERPPEDWIVKARRGEATVDVLHRVNGRAVDRELLALAHEEDVLGLRIPVLPAGEVVVQKLCSLTEHYCDFGALLPVVRAVREQVDWPAVRDRTADNDFAVAFLVLTDRLGITT